MMKDQFIQQNGGDVKTILSTMQGQNQRPDLASVWLCYVNSKTVEEVNMCNLQAEVVAQDVA